jgi:hypothetical protein
VDLRLKVYQNVPNNHSGQSDYQQLFRNYLCGALIDRWGNSNVMPGLVKQKMMSELRRMFFHEKTPSADLDGVF